MTFRVNIERRAEIIKRRSEINGANNLATVKINVLPELNVTDANKIRINLESQMIDINFSTQNIADGLAIPASTSLKPENLTEPDFFKDLFFQDVQDPFYSCLSTINEEKTRINFCEYFIRRYCADFMYHTNDPAKYKQTLDKSLMQLIKDVQKNKAEEKFDAVAAKLKKPSIESMPELWATELGLQEWNKQCTTICNNVWQTYWHHLFCLTQTLNFNAAEIDYLISNLNTTTPLQIQAEQLDPSLNLLGLNLQIEFPKEQYSITLCPKDKYDNTSVFNISVTAIRPKKQKTLALFTSNKTKQQASDVKNKPQDATYDTGYYVYLNAELGETDVDEEEEEQDYYTRSDTGELTRLPKPKVKYTGSIMIARLAACHIANTLIKIKQIHRILIDQGKNKMPINFDEVFQAMATLFYYSQVKIYPACVSDYMDARPAYLSAQDFAEDFAKLLTTTDWCNYKLNSNASANIMNQYTDTTTRLKHYIQKHNKK